jgi:lysophospholipase L1-like esterase
MTEITYTKVRNDYFTAADAMAIKNAVNDNLADVEARFPSGVISNTSLGFVLSPNLFDKTLAIANKYVSNTTGAVLDHASYFVSGYVPVVAGSTYSVSGEKAKLYAWYDSSKVFISGGADLTGGVTAPTGAAFLQTTFGNSSTLDNYQIEQGTSAAAYSEYGSYTCGNSALINLVNNAVINTTRFKGKNINFLGDSITWGYSPIDGTQIVENFSKIVGDSLGLSNSRNYGVIGSTISSESNPFSTRYLDMDDDADLVFVLGGTNDWAYSIAIGTINDSANTTFYGALNILVDGLITKYPGKTIVISTPMHRANGETLLGMVNYANAIIAIGKKYGVHVCDLYSDSGFYPDNAANLSAICPDGRHPNESGHVVLSNRIIGFLKSV